MLVLGALGTDGQAVEHERGGFAAEDAGILGHIVDFGNCEIILRFLFHRMGLWTLHKPIP